MSHILSSAAAQLIALQVFVFLLFVDCQFFFPTSTTPSDEHTVNIFGGIKSYTGEFPFMAALGWKDKSGKLSFHGAGMVISPRMILTAAHCVYLDGKLPDAVFIGGKPLSDDPYEQLFTRYSVANVTIFPEYDPRQGYDDIAIMELTDSTRFPPICLWDKENLNTDEVTAIGYGLTEFAGSGSKDLLKVQLTVFSSDYCAPFFERQRKFKSGISDTHICAGDKDGNKDTCQGDSGGPLIVKHKHFNFAVGITSSGQACSGFPPAIYTKIHPYREWIANVLREKGQSLQSCAPPEPKKKLSHKGGLLSFGEYIDF